MSYLICKISVTNTLSSRRVFWHLLHLALPLMSIMLLTVLNTVDPQKNPGPGTISSCMLKECAEQLGPIFKYIFRLSLSQQRVPHLWKQSVVVPVAKVSHPQTLNDLNPVVLTSLVVKSLEKLLKAELLAKVEPLLDPFQFAYRAKRRVQDAAITLLSLFYKHLEVGGNHTRLLFLDFSSAFDTIQPHLPAEKLLITLALIRAWSAGYLIFSLRDVGG